MPQTLKNKIIFNIATKIPRIDTNTKIILAPKYKIVLFWHSLEIKKTLKPQGFESHRRTYGVQLLNRLGHADPYVTLKAYSNFVQSMKVKIEEYMEKIL